MQRANTHWFYFDVGDWALWAISHAVTAAKGHIWGAIIIKFLSEG